MTDQMVIEAIVGALVIGSRILSHFEHKKSNKDVNEIKFYINGDLQKRLDEAREQGRQEILNKK